MRVRVRGRGRVRVRVRGRGRGRGRGRVRGRLRVRGRGRGRGVRYFSPNPRSFIWGSAGCEKSKGGNPGSPDVLTRRWSCCLAKLPEATVTR